MGNKLINVATTEAHPPLGNALRKIGRTWHSLADLDHAQSISECVILGDSLGYQGMNARSAKETLQMRTGVLEEYQAAVKTTISKRRQIERLKASSNIRPDRVDEALEDMEEVCSFTFLSVFPPQVSFWQANKYEQVLAKRAEGISQNLHQALQIHNRYANDDITTALIEHTRSSIMYERQLLRELESLRGDISNAAKKNVVAVDGVPKPSVVPPLEDFSDHPPSAPLVNGFHRHQSHLRTPPHTAVPSSQSFTPHLPPPQVAYQKNQPLPASSNQPFSPQLSHSRGLPPQSPGAGPSTPASSQFPSSKSAVVEPPLGGRFVDGTKSMFINPTFSTLASSSPASSSSAGISGSPSRPQLDPLRSNAYNGQSVPSPLHDSAPKGLHSHASLHQETDPLAQIKPHQMASSMRVQPTRPRLDPREAASKLANMF